MRAVLRTAVVAIGAASLWVLWLLSSCRQATAAGNPGSEGRSVFNSNTLVNRWVERQVNFVEASPIMAVAAFVLSLVAVLVAVVSAWYARRQAVSAEGVRIIEAARRHDELCPDLTGEYVTARKTRDGQRPGVKLTNKGPLDLGHVDVMAVPAHRAHEAVIEGIYHPRGRTISTHETGTLRRGESWTFDVIPAQHVVDGHNLDRAALPSSAASVTPMGMSRGRSSSL